MEHINAVDAGGQSDLAYSPVARRLHWWVAGLVAFMIAVGHLMNDDDNPFGLSEAFRGQLSSVHKLVGFVLLWLVVARLVYRIRHGAPPSEPTLTPLEKGGSHAVHWLLYLLLILMPLGGWIGVSLYGARDIFGLFSLPAITPIDQKLSETIFTIHGYGAWVVLLLALGHIGAALFHYAVRKDGVLARMWPSAGRRD